MLSFEELDRAFVSLCRGSRLERSEVAALAGPGILLARVESVFAGREPSNHWVYPDARGKANENVVPSSFDERTEIVPPCDRTI